MSQLAWQIEWANELWTPRYSCTIQGFFPRYNLVLRSPSASTHAQSSAQNLCIMASRDAEAITADVLKFDEVSIVQM